MEDQKTHFVILLAGPLTTTQRVAKKVKGARVVAADGGIAHATTLGLQPEIWIGDFDSSLPEAYPQFAAIPRMSHPAGKDKTDGALATEWALQQGATHITMVGALGGRTDHGFALMAGASALARKGLQICLTNGQEEAHPMPRTPTEFDYPPGTLFSVLGLSKLTGLTLQGVRWPLDDVSVSLGDTLTISNEVATRLTACLTQGDALLLAQL